MKWTVLSDNRSNDSRLFTEHGLSILLEAEQHRILLDTGASDVFINNAEQLGLDLSTVDYVFISHGLLRPLDAILPYRMEGNVELPSGEGQNMFGFWKSRLTDVLIDSVKADGGILVHLATEEYQHLFDWQRVRKEVRVVQPLFYVRKGCELKIQAVWAKTCRGAMTRFIIENRIDKPEDLCAFSYEGFSYEPKLGERLRVGEHSSGIPDFPHFIKQ